MKWLTIVVLVFAIAAAIAAGGCYAWNACLLWP